MQIFKVEVIEVSHRILEVPSENIESAAAAVESCDTACIFDWEWGERTSWHIESVTPK